MVRADSDVAAAARTTVPQIEPGMALKIGTLENFHTQAVAPAPLPEFLLIAFTRVAATLAAAGVYGVMSYTTTQRQPEMGGASRLQRRARTSWASCSAAPRGLRALALLSGSSWPWPPAA